MTPLFPGAADGPRVFYLPPGADMAADLARGLRARLGDASPAAVADLTLLLNTRRAERAIVSAFERTDGGATFLPRMIQMGEIATSGLLDAAPPNAVSPLRRTLALTRLVELLLEREPSFGGRGSAPSLAAALGDLIGEMEREGLAPNALDGAAPEDLARHWDLTLRFAAIAREAWPRHLAEAEGGAVDPETRQRFAALALAARWASDPPEGPLIAAGSTGSVGFTATLLQAVARAPQGAVVLPGFAPMRDPALWATITDEHPWASIARLLEALDIDPAAVPPWLPEAAHAAGAPRRALLSDALRPAPATDGWRAAAGRIAREAEAATAGLELIEADGPRREAAAIALVLREALETEGARAALVTPDRALARRVASELARWGIAPDDSGGRPLGLTPPGVFLRLIAELAAAPRLDATKLLSLLKHPLTASGEGRGHALGAARIVEMKVLRRRADLVDFETLRAAVAALEAPEREAAAPAIAALDAVAALREAGEELAALIAAHRAAAERIAAGAAQAGAGALWERAAGAAALAAIEAFAGAADAYGAAALADYPALLFAAFAGEAREEAFRPHDRVMIWGPLEARMQTADLVVLGGLNDRVWPQLPGVEPWLNRPMREKLGLPSPERRIGLSAHDFLSAACASRAVLTRSLRADGAPTSPSRWVTRLTTLLGGVAPDALAAMRARGAARLALVERLHRPAGAAAPEQRPAPTPPVAARPRRLSVTQIETLIRDPYAIYARHVLRLRPLDPIGRAPDARERGTAIHRIFQRIAEETPYGWPANAAALVDRIADEELAAYAADPAMRLLWRARLARLRDWFVSSEAARRAVAAPVKCEVSGALVFAAPGGEFTLTAKADRIDRRADGALDILDYKTGPPPSKKQVAAFDKQMPLQAAIAAAGGFTGLPAAPVEEMVYVHLKGTGFVGEAKPLELQEDAAETLRRLRELIAAYDDPAQPYISRARPALLTYASDYDHLARHGEWDDKGPVG